MFRVFYDKVDQFTARYGNHFDENVLNLLYEIRHVCDYQIFYTSCVFETDPTAKVHMGDTISNEPMNKILSLVEQIMEKIEEGIALKVEPVPI